LRRMNISRSIKSLAIYEVDRDRDLVFLDLKVLGLRTSKSSFRIEKYSAYFRILDNFICSLSLGDLTRDYEDRIYYYMSKPIFCRLYYDSRFIVKYVVLASFYPGIIKNLSRFLEENYWKRVFLFEVMRMKQSSREMHFSSGSEI